MFFSVKDFKKVNKPWGSFRRVIGELPILDTNGIILLMKENDDGRESIAVHDKRDGKMILSLGHYLVETEQDKQKALDKIFDTIMKG